MNIFVKLMICVSVVLSLINISYANNLDDILSALQKAKFSEKEDLLSQIADIKSNRSLIILQYIESGNLYYTKSHFPLEISQQAFNNLWRMCESYELWCKESKQKDLIFLNIID